MHIYIYICIYKRAWLASMRASSPSLVWRSDSIFVLGMSVQIIIMTLSGCVCIYMYAHVC